MKSFIKSINYATEFSDRLIYDIKSSLLRVDLTQFLKCTRFFKFVLRGLYLETILWCTSYKYIHATCIFAFISVFNHGQQ